MMNELLFPPLLMALIMAINSPYFEVQKNTSALVLAIHGAVPMVVHDYVPMWQRPLPQAGWPLGGKIVGERSNGVRSVGRPSLSLANVKVFAS